MFITNLCNRKEQFAWYERTRKNQDSQTIKYHSHFVLLSQSMSFIMLLSEYIFCETFCCLLEAMTLYNITSIMCGIVNGTILLRVALQILYQKHRWLVKSRPLPAIVIFSRNPSRLYSSALPQKCLHISSHF